MKPHLACDADLDTITLPKIILPKIDGVRGINLFGGMTGRSLKQHKNRFTTSIFSHSGMLGFDGELAAAELTHPNLCSLTTSAVGTIQGEPFVTWNVFDYIRPETYRMPYRERIMQLDRELFKLQADGVPYSERIRMVDFWTASTLEDLLAAHEYFLAKGYEGTIARDPEGIHKNGRCTDREQAYLRLKPFIDAEIVVTRLEEGETNNNEATTNALGQTERSSHKANMVPNGMVGAMYGNLLEDLIYRGTLLFPKGMEVKVSAGKLTHAQRKFFWENPNQLVGSVVKFQTLPIGIKDKPRMGTYQSHRLRSDMG